MFEILWVLIWKFSMLNWAMLGNSVFFYVFFFFYKTLFLRVLHISKNAGMNIGTFLFKVGVIEGSEREVHINQIYVLYCIEWWNIRKEFWLTHWKQPQIPDSHVFLQGKVKGHFEEHFWSFKKTRYKSGQRLFFAASYEDLGSVEYPFIAITIQSLLTWSRHTS